MRYRHFLRIDEATLPKNAFEQICRIAPGGRKPYGFDLQVDSESPDGGEIVGSIIAICAAHGLKRRRIVNDTSYGHSADRWYDDEAYRNAELLVLSRQSKIQGLARPERDEKGRLLLDRKNVKTASKLGLGRIFPNWIVVSYKVRQLLQAEKFIGLEFIEVAVSDGSDDQFWELQSSIVLPKMANCHQFVHPGTTGIEPFKGDYSKTIMLNDPPFNKGEIHYRRSDIALVGEFDFARTFENYMEPHYAFVVSQRFYRSCTRHKIRLYVDPVRIDPE